MSKESKTGAAFRQGHLVSSLCLDGVKTPPFFKITLSQGLNCWEHSSFPLQSQLLDAPENSNGFLSILHSGSLPFKLYRPLGYLAFSGPPAQKSLMPEPTHVWPTRCLPWVCFGADPLLPYVIHKTVSSTPHFLQLLSTILVLLTTGCSSSRLIPPICHMQLTTSMSDMKTGAHLTKKLSCRSKTNECFLNF